jgi:hypothetical protein
MANQPQSEPVEDELAARRRLREAVAKLDADVASGKGARRRRLFGPVQMAQVTKILIMILALFAILAFREQCGHGVVGLFDTLAPPAPAPK